MYKCVFVCMCVRACVSTCVYAYVCVCVRLSVGMAVCIHFKMHLFNKSNNHIHTLSIRMPMEKG